MKVKKMAAMGTALTMALLLTACGGGPRRMRMLCQWIFPA